VGALYASHLQSLTRIQRGKVRDIYAVDPDHLLIITTDRLSAFDTVLPTPIPGKGRVLTALSNFWMARLSHIVPNHLTRIASTDLLDSARDRQQAEGRTVVVRRLKPLPVEAIVRGYLVGSGWKDYQATGTLCGERLPRGMQLADPLPVPLFTPSTKAAIGAHDENISFACMAELIGTDLALQVRDTSFALYREAATYALECGVIIADTKFEFGLDEHQNLVLIDEALTPDSSRFWPVDQYQAGVNPPSFDKQYVRDWLNTLPWDRKPPAPELPPEVVVQTADRYRDVLEKLTVPENPSE